METKRLLTAEEVAKMINRSKKTVWRLWAKEKVFPKPILINGRALGWRQSTLERFFETGQIDDR